MNIFKKKSLESVREASSVNSLTKTMGPIDMVLLGLGGIIGSGVFVLTGMVAAKFAGPAVIASYIIAGLVCILVALVYSELAIFLPTAGSIYTYSYVAFGEIFAWLTLGVLIGEMCFSSAAVAASWSGYMRGVLVESMGINIPEALTKIPANGGIIDLPAVIITLLVGFILFFGTKDSKVVNAIFVLIKIIVIGVFIASAVPHFNTNNLENFMPFGMSGVLQGSSILFFAYTGFGALAAAAEECKNPRRDLLIGITGSLLLSALLYAIVAVCAVGISPYQDLGNAQPLADALRRNGSDLGSLIVGIGAVCGMTTVLMANIYALSRIFYAIARDGLLPAAFAKVHPTHHSPYIGILFLVVWIAIMTGLLPYEDIAQMASMCSLVDYAIVAIIAMLFRVRYPDAYRAFKCPAIFVVAPVAVIACLYLIATQMFDMETFALTLNGRTFFIWFGVMLAVYFARKLVRV